MSESAITLKDRVADELEALARRRGKSTDEIGQLLFEKLLVDKPRESREEALERILELHNIANPGMFESGDPFE